MKRLSYILVLFFLSTVYLFPQTEENKIIKVDTVMIMDTVVIAEPTDKQEEKKDVIKRDFYNDYLRSDDYLSLKIETDSIKKSNFENDTLALKKGQISIAAISGGSAFATDRGSRIMGSLTFRVSNGGFHGIVAYSSTWDQKYNCFSIKVGYSYVSGRGILDISVGPPGWGKVGKIGDFGGGRHDPFYTINDITYYHRLSKNMMFSLNLGAILIIPVSFSIGIGTIIDNY